MAQRSNPALSKPAVGKKSCKTDYLNRDESAAHLDRGQERVRQKAEYICVDKPVVFIFRLRQGDRSKYTR